MDLPENLDFSSVCKGTGPLWAFVSGGRVAHAYVMKRQRVFALGCVCGVEAPMESRRKVVGKSPKCQKCQKILEMVRRGNGSS